MTLVQLEYALTVHKVGSISKAAEICHVTQPTLTIQLKKLEDSLGTKLFNRQRHPLEATALGRSLLEQAARVLAEAKKIENLAQDQAGPLTGLFRLAIIPSTAGSLIPAIVPALARAHPQLKMTVSEMQTKNLVAGLHRGDFDAGIAAVPLEDSSLKASPLYQEGFRVFLPPRHRLLKQSAIRASDLAEERLLLMGEGHCFRNQALKICQYQKVNEGLFIESGSFETMIEMVSQGQGLTVLPHLVAQRLDRNTSRRLRPFVGLEPVREIALLQTDAPPRSRASAELVKLVREVIQLPQKKGATVVAPF